MKKATVGYLESEFLP